MIGRYTLPEMGALWTEQSKFQKWLEVEIAVCEVHAEMGTIPRDALEQIKARAKFSVERINEIEQTTNHDVIAFTTNLAENIGEASRFVHYGLTSSDIVDTANALLLREACDILLGKIEALLDVLKRRALEFKHTPQIGRTHGIHAEPTSFGLTFALLDPEVEEKVCARLGLRAAPVSTQIIQRDCYAEYLCTLAVVASSLDKFALNIRHWQRTEVGEAQERFSVGQKGSSAMPHKRNPIISERVCGIARVIRAHSLVGLENVALWHERDISHSSAERVVLPDASIALDYILHKVTSLIAGLVVHPQRMLQNLQLSRGLIFSGQLLLALTQKGVSRESAYDWVQRNAMKVWDQNENFQMLLQQDADIRKHLSPEEIDGAFKFDSYLRNVDKIFSRVFSGE